MYPRAFLDMLRHLRGTAFAPDADIEPKPTRLLESAISIRTIVIEEYPQFGDLALYLTDHYCFQRRDIADVAGTTKLV